MATTDGTGGILFASMPYAGLINPLLTIAGEVNSRSTTETRTTETRTTDTGAADKGAADTRAPGIWFAAAEERRSDVERLPGATKARFASMGPQKAEIDPANWDDETLAAMTPSSSSRIRAMAAMIDRILDYENIRQCYHRMLEIIDEVRPALMVVDLSSQWAIDAARKRGVPYVVTVPIPISSTYKERLPWRYPTPFSGLPLDMTLRQKIDNALFRIGASAVFLHPRRMRTGIAALAGRRAEGLANPEMRPSNYADAAVATIATSVFGIEYPFPDPPANLRMLGPMIPPDEDLDDTGDDLSRWLDEHGSVVYIGFGTIVRPTAEHAEAIVAATAGLAPEHAVLWKVPRKQQHLLPVDLPENLRVVDWVPSQLAVLAHPNVKVFVNHAAGNAVHEGLYFGKPLLMLPFWMDCLDFAARVVDIGAGLALDGMRPDELVAKTMRLLTEDQFREQAELWSVRLRAAGGVRAAADLVLAEHATRT